jgi:hypothetical protein
MSSLLLTSILCGARASLYFKSLPKNCCLQIQHKKLKQSLLPTNEEGEQRMDRDHHSAYHGMVRCLPFHATDDLQLCRVSHM